MMEMKSQMRIESGLTPLKSMEEERFDAERSRRRREERRNRRLRRQRSVLGLDEEEVKEAIDGGGEEKKDEVVEPVSILKGKRVQSDGGDSTKNGADVKKKGVCWDQDVKAGNIETAGYETNINAKTEEATPVDTKKNGVCWSQDAGTEAECDKSISNPDTSPKEKRTHTKVMCPVCQIILKCNEEDGPPDEFLSKHIEECQKNRARGGRTLRRRTKPAFVDVDDENDDDAGIPTTIIRTLRTKSGAANATKVSDKGEKQLFDDDIESDDNEPQQTVQYDASKAVDDMDEFDYEDRVDDWVDRGIERMKDMSERDATESPPGAVLYEGGLEVPAWINDRLFPYQRTGLRWMWELHLQGAGGCIGDEMVSIVHFSKDFEYSRYCRFSLKAWEHDASGLGKDSAGSCFYRFYGSQSSLGFSSDHSSSHNAQSLVVRIGSLGSWFTSYYGA
jgi:hypothetical protein